MSLSKNVKKITLWNVAIPSIVMTLINTVSAPINTFISSDINKTAVEAVGTAGGLMMLFGVLMSLLTGGAGIVISQYIGRKTSNEDLKKATDSTFLVSLFQGIIVFAIVMSLNKVLLRAWGLHDGTQQMKDASLYIYSLAPTYILIGIGNYFITTSSVYGNPKWTTAIGIYQMLLNMMLSFVFVHYADLGIKGLIFATIIARVVAVTLALILYSWKVQRFWMIRSFNWIVTKKLIGISVPIAGEKINYNIGSFVRGVIIGSVAIKIGLESVDHNYMIWSRAIFGSLQAITLVGSVGFSIAVESVVSRMLGSSKFEDAKKTVMKAYIYALIIDIPIALMIFFVQVPLINFLTSSEKDINNVNILKDQLKWTFLVLVALEIGRAANLVYIAATRSAGDTKYTAIISVPITWLFSILLAWILARYAHLGWMGIVIGMTLDECIRGLVNYVRWKSGKWRKFADKIHDVPSKVDDEMIENKINEMRVRESL